MNIKCRYRDKRTMKESAAENKQNINCHTPLKEFIMFLHQTEMSEG